MIGTIYKITNSINDKVYIGQTWLKLSERCRSSKSYKDCPKLKNAFNKHGFENFQIESICTADTQEWLDLMEIRFISYYNSIKNGYNCMSGGSRGKHSEETKKKIGDASRGRKQSKEQREKLRLSKLGELNPMFGKKHTDEHKENISKALKGIKREPLSVDHKKNISEALKGRGSNSGSFGKGKDHPSFGKSKLSKEEKQLIKQDTRAYKEIAKDFNIGTSTVSRIKNKCPEKLF